MEISNDPYELKLFQMFQSCDNKRCGHLDEDSLRKLCGLLELRDKGAVLIGNLAVEGKPTRVTFENFKEALLNFLGTELDSTSSTAVPTLESSKQGGLRKNVINSNERALTIADEAESYIESPPESSDREVSPKLIVGSKKYGRRSKPQTHKGDELSFSESDENSERELNSHRGCYGNKIVQRSSSQTDITGSRGYPTPSYAESKLKRCASLPPQRNLLNQSKIRIANKPKPLKDTPSQLAKQQSHNSSVESLDTPALMESLPVNSILDIWERANISNGRGILRALGFDEDEINLAQLSKVMEEELRSLEDEPQLALLRALLVLQSTELGTLRQTARQLYDENAKLRADNKDANNRIVLLAAEIDERHASLEDASKKEILMLEQRHAAVVRDLTARLTNDRENWATLNARLEARIKSFEQNEIKLKTELDLIHKENEDLEIEQQKMQKQITELLEKNIELHKELADLEENTHKDVCAHEAIKNSEDDDVLHLMEKVSTLQMENTNLRDKNDELVAEVESLNMELTRVKAKNKKSIVMEEGIVDETDVGTGSTAIKRRGDSPSKTRTIEESPRFSKLRKCANESGTACSENSDTSGEWVALNSELQNSSPANEEIVSLKQKVSELEEQLKSTEDSGINSNASDERCKELEASLEQMQRAYEDCEDYWQTKLSEERALFEKERQIYEEEQQESDKKFTELMEKVREYEEQFSKDGRLSPIEEKDILEQQYADLEAEAEEIRENARRMFEEKTREIEILQNEIEDLRVRLGESVEILTGACELNAEAVTAATNGQSPASSPISYLWHQSTIHEVSKNCQVQVSESPTISVVRLPSPNNQASRNNLSTSETTIFSTTPIAHNVQTPIEKPSGESKTTSAQSEAGDVADCETSSTASGKSFETNSISSTHSAQRSGQLAQQTKSNSSAKNSCSSPSDIKEELKRLKFFELSLKEQIKDLSLQRDGLVMELQQLQEARPFLEKAYARTAHPSLMQRVNQLELRNRHLQNVIKQTQQYTESVMQQTWRQHQVELNDLHGRLDAQGVLIAEQIQRLQNADVLVKDLYVENSHLTATVQRLEQQRVRANLMQQQRQGCHGLPGMP